ncbi:MAG TPA: hypothetical protein VFJ16_19215 [Longimicrobium sp.]|nr:hypothetical protein [Longimicrobium sp.]
MMKKRVNAIALAVIVGGAGLLARPGSASATYINPWTGGGDNGGVTFCCKTDDTFCCYNTGCATSPGRCVKVVPAT